MTTFVHRIWAPALAALTLALSACGGGGAPQATQAQTAAAPVLRVDGWTQPAYNTASVGTIKSRALDARPVAVRIVLPALAAEKTAIASGPGPQLIGLARDVAATRSAEATRSQWAWKPTAAGGAVAALSFTARDAKALRLGVSVEALPGSAVLRVYSQAHPSQVYQISGQEVLQRVQTNLDAGTPEAEARLWWTPDIAGEEATVEIELPAGTPVAAVRVAVPRLSHIFEDLSLPTAQEEALLAKINESASCHLDATCYDTYANQRNAMARMIYTRDGLTYLCTGTLLNDANASGTPYFLTANHCISTQASASSLITDWFYRAPTCNSRTLSTATTRRMGGAALLYASDSTDMTLLRLNDTPPPGAFFAGWDANAQGLGTSIVGLHHPRGDLLKATFGSISGQSSCASSGGTQFQCVGTTGNFHRVTWTQGTTEGGSSGSSIFKDGTHVVGTLYGGSSTCTAIGSPEFYGRFDVAYNAALKQWLGASSGGSGRSPVYRFYNSSTGAHFFTTNAAERDFVIQTYPQFAYENIAFYAYANPTAGQSTVFRFFNTGNGAHFYTINPLERDFVIQNYPVFKYEGPIWYAQTAAGNGAVPIYRFYRPKSGTHFYTINPLERDFVIQNYKDYQFEDVAYYAWTAQ
ncbi:trypsin-like peptidase domain-containing protein [Acidovorax lacteus]|uniref:DUF5648 domain-containing protein n=1 Tax=Acidovorax lacteus TaxID=1924988 RepID=A0ABP8LC27_9BURK